MRELAGRLSAVDPDAGAAVGVIAYFDRLAEARAGVEALVRGAAVLAGVPVRLVDEGRRVRVRVEADGVRRDVEGEADPAWPWAPLAAGGPPALWLERADGPATVVDAVILERAAGVVRRVLDRTRGRAPYDDPALIETLLDASAPEQARLHAARRLGLAPDARVRVAVPAEGPPYLIPETGAGTGGSGVPRPGKGPGTSGGSGSFGSPGILGGSGPFDSPGILDSPGSPGNSRTPASSRTSGGPGTSSNSRTSASPRALGGSGSLGGPGTPGSPRASANPRTPGSPGTPGNSGPSGGPRTPGAPGAPGHPHAGARSRSDTAAQDHASTPTPRTGLGPAVPVLALPDSWAAARTALRFTAEGTARDPGPRVVGTDELGGIGMLAELVSPGGELPEDVRALERAAGEAPWMLATLHAVALTPSLRAAATELTVHHSTMQDRLAHAEGVLGWSVRTPPGRFRLQLALTMRRLARS